MKVDLLLYAMVGATSASHIRDLKRADSGYQPKNEYSHDDSYHESAPEYGYQPTPTAYGYEPSPIPDSSYPANSDYPSGGYQTDSYGSEYPNDKSPKAWSPLSQDPDFFSLKVDARCLLGSQTTAAAAPPQQTDPLVPNPETPAEIAANDCFFAGFGIRLQHGIAIATPYNRWYDSKLPVFFVDDDTQTYTVSKKTLQLYIDSIDGGLKYAPVGWLPPNAIAISFYKLGTNPLGLVGPSPAYFAWPSTEGRLNAQGQGETWWLCPLSRTGQYQVFISNVNFGPSSQGGVGKTGCVLMGLAAVNANPWSSGH